MFYLHITRTRPTLSRYSVDTMGHEPHKEVFNNTFTRAQLEYKRIHHEQSLQRIFFFIKNKRRTKILGAELGG